MQCENNLADASLAYSHIKHIINGLNLVFHDTERKSENVQGK